ncbi:MAG: KTSC domain-containing protein [bacterium]
MDRTSVTSSVIVSVGYDAASQTLEIEFRSGRVYQYFGVPEHVYSGLMGAASRGNYFDTHIRDAGYQYARSYD